MVAGVILKTVWVIVFFDDLMFQLWYRRFHLIIARCEIATSYEIRRQEIFMEKRKRVVINRDWCKSCGICVAFCPKEALVMDHQEKAEWAHQEKCISCGLCELRCPDLAIELEDMES